MFKNKDKRVYSPKYCRFFYKDDFNPQNLHCFAQFIATLSFYIYANVL